MIVKDIVDGQRFACKCYDKQNIDDVNITIVIFKLMVEVMVFLGSDLQ